MAAYSVSVSVFKSRVEGSGLSDEDVSKVLTKISSLRQLAFISSYSPGQPDEKPLMDVLEEVIGRPPELDVKATFRALFHEAYAIVTAEMRQQIEKGDEPSSRRLSQPERSERYERQCRKLAGVSIKGHSEPSESLVDLAVSCYESNEIRYIPWERCASREQEVTSERKKDTRFTVDEASGRLKIDNKDPEEKANTSSEVYVLQALQRRSLALDQASLVDFAVIERWSEVLVRSCLIEPLPGFQKPSWDQLLAADKEVL